LTERMLGHAGMAKLADAADLKAGTSYLLSVSK
jgi:hypothetical protein